MNDLSHHVMTRKKKLKKKAQRDNDNWRNRQAAKDRQYKRSKEKFEVVF